MMFARCLKSSSFGASHTVTSLVLAWTIRPLLAVAEPWTSTGCAPLAGGQSAGSTTERAGSPLHFHPPEKVVPDPHRLAGEVAGEEVAAEAAHPVEEPQDFLVEILVAAAEVLDHRGVEAVTQVAVEAQRVLGQPAVVESRRPRRRTARSGRSSNIGRSSGRPWRRSGSRRPRDPGAPGRCPRPRHRRWNARRGTRGRCRSRTAGRRRAANSSTAACSRAE